MKYFLVILLVVLGLSADSFAMGRKAPKEPEPLPAPAVTTQVEPIVAPAPEVKTQEPVQGAEPLPLSGEQVPPQAAVAVQEEMTDIEIQRALKNAGFDPGKIDGKIGPKTRSAIRQFQKSNGLTVDGKAGVKTKEALRNNLVSPESHSHSEEIVNSPENARNREIQQALKNAGFDTGKIDGKIGPRTRAAIKEFQVKYGLAPDGKIKDEDWSELKKYLEVSK